MLENRWLIIILTGGNISVILLSALNWPGWQCPVQATLGITCPGCGLTTAVGLLLQGNCKSALQVHAFAPLAVLVSAFMTVASLLSTDKRRRMARWIGLLEKRTGVVAIGLTGMVAYWFVRLFEIL